MRSESGFTLLEVMIALLILAVGLMATINMQATALRADGFAQRTTMSSTVARGALEEVMSRPGSSTFFQTAQVNAAHDLDPQTAALTQTMQGVTFNAVISVTPNTVIGGVAVTNLTRIDLTVTGGGRTVNLTEFKRAI